MASAIYQAVHSAGLYHDDETLLNGRSWTDSPIHMQLKANTKKFETITIEKALSLIGADIESDDTKHIVNQYRNALFEYDVAKQNEKKGYEKAKDDLKKIIPSVCFSGQFKGSRSKVNFIPESCTNTFVIDIDKLDLTVVAKHKKILTDLPFVRFAFVSPSENGLKAGLHVPAFKNDDDIKIIFEHVKRYFKDRFNITLDDQCKDVSRLCLLSIDKDIYTNEYATMLDIDMNPEPTSNASSSAGKSFDDEFEVLPKDSAESQGGSVRKQKKVVQFSTSKDNYVNKGLEGELATLASASKGNRNSTLNEVAFNGFGLLYANGCVAMYDVFREQLLSTAKQVGLSEKESLITINSAFKSKERASRKPYEEIAQTRTNQVASVSHIGNNSNTSGGNNSSDDNFSELIGDMNKDYSVVSMSGKSRVAHLKYDGKYDLQTFQDFKNFHLNKTVSVVVDKKVKDISQATIWLNSALRKEYLQGIEFFPTHGDADRKNGKLNTWRGFPHERIKYDPKRIKPFLHYIENIVCGGNKEYCNYLTGWIAYSFQKPHLQTKVAIVLRGNKGGGKSILGDLLMILWGHHSVRISDSKSIAGNFNGTLENKCFVSGEEAIYHGDKKSEGILKSIITDPTLHIERKGFDAVQHPNRLKIMLTANDDHVIPSSHDERRYFCLHVKDKFKSKADRFEYYEDIYKLRGEGEEGIDRDNEAFSMFFDYFLSYDLTGFNPMNYPETDENRNQMEESLGYIPKFLLECCERGYIASLRKGESVSGYKIPDQDDTCGEVELYPDWYTSVSLLAVKKAMEEWGQRNYKSTYDKVEKNDISRYFVKRLKLKAICKGATLAPSPNGYTTKNCKGYQLGFPSELEERIRKAENLTPLIDDDDASTAEIEGDDF